MRPKLAPEPGDGIGRPAYGVSSMKVVRDSRSPLKLNGEISRED